MVIKLKALGRFIYDSRIKVITTIMCVALCAVNIFTTASGANNIKIYVDGVEHEINTHRADANDILAQSEIEFDEENSFIDTSLFDEYGIINIESFKTVTIIDGENEIIHRGHGPVANVIEQAGITLAEDDSIEGCKLNDYVTDDLIIKIKRSFSVMISADGEITTVHMSSGTVADALSKAVITADDNDIVSRPLDEELSENTSLKVTRIDYVQREETQVIKFSTKTEKTNTLNQGQSKIKQAGVNGEKVSAYEDKYVNGELTESTLKSTTTTKEAVDEIKLVGTKAVAAASIGSVTAKGAKLAASIKTISTFTAPSSLQLTSNNVPTSYKKKLVGTASAYYGGGITSTGKSVRPGHVAVNPRQIPYHTAMWIVSNDGNYVYGYCFAEDTGGFVKWTGNRATLCDLYMNSKQQCVNFGRRSVTIYIL